MSRNRPERKAWRKSVIEAKALEAAAAPSVATAKLRGVVFSAPVRGVLALIVTAVCAYALLKGLVWGANRLGVMTWVHYDYPVTRTIYLNHSPYLTLISSEYTLSWRLLALLSTVLAFFAGRCVWYGDFRAAFTQRARWLMVGWMLGLGLLIVEIELALRGDMPLVTRISGWKLYVFLFAWMISGNYFCVFWSWLMRRWGVPEEDEFTSDTR